ncbi:MAG TPA: SDR family NAD(P)-dependent oxidoreductase [Nocardia sp.]|uniref:SDR family NAD(P)-dependent oxidoreductase n=1 Tax=Nocardia TaxID=1817 RepID=UPI002454F321|nr:MULTISPECIES: SDR family NAD(P)-dependent oxidoreductase [Nocardia]HLS75325.1 SDR family NAD(P)-dependent oxidoreductase [Nocardia sp.]
MSGTGSVRAAVVTGGSRGIGLEVAAALARAGAGVVVNGRDPVAVDAAVARLRRDGGRALGIAGSAAEEHVAEDAVAACVREYGAIDALVNCAGTAEPEGSSILNITAAQWHSLLDAHLGTVFATCRAAAPRMVAQGGGAIVNTSSFAWLGDYGGTGYAAGKGAVTSLTLAIAAELKEHGVRANVVCPGARTRLSTGPDYEAKIRELHRRGMLDELSVQGALDAPPAEYAARLYQFLTGPLARGVTGQIFVAAGNFVGRFDRQAPAILGYRDHTDSPPWEPEELAAMITAERAPR